MTWSLQEPCSCDSYFTFATLGIEPRPSCKLASTLHRWKTSPALSFRLEDSVQRASEGWMHWMTTVLEKVTSRGLIGSQVSNHSATVYQHWRHLSWFLFVFVLKYIVQADFILLCRQGWPWTPDPLPTCRISWVHHNMAFIFAALQTNYHLIYIPSSFSHLLFLRQVLYM